MIDDAVAFIETRALHFYPAITDCMMYGKNILFKTTRCGFSLKTNIIQYEIAWLVPEKASMHNPE